MVRVTTVLSLAVVATLAAGCDCSGTTPANTRDAGLDASGLDAGGFVLPDANVDTGPPPVAPNPEAFWADDPPPQLCLPDGGMGPDPEVPGGTPECPDDKNREGCRCDTPGETASCWPGLRVNRNRGICHDGVTTCQAYDEFSGVWGPCEGAVLPVEGVTLGPQACECFSQGRWAIQNLSPCFVDYGGGAYYAVSTFVGSSGNAQCPTSLSSTPPPAPEPGVAWSGDSLTVDCAGRFNLCYTLRAGDFAAPSSSDCVVARVCTGDVWYPEAGAELVLPDLDGWSSSDSACATQFATTGGYGEMSVIGRSIECEEIDDGSGGEYVFNRVNYCPLACSTGGDVPDGVDCTACMMGGSGSF